MKTTKPEEWKLHTRTFDMPKVEAICAHGIGHHQGTHGCDGCCFNMPEDIKNKTTKDI